MNGTAQGNKRVDYVPGISSTRLADIPFIDGNKQQILQGIQKNVQWVAKAQYLLFTSTYEHESQTIDVLKAEFPFPVYAIGPTIPFFDLAENISLASHDDSDLNYLEWLDCQPRSSVLYEATSHFLVLKRMNLQPVCEIAVPDSCGWRAVKLVG
jgi:hypothetical protein